MPAPLLNQEGWIKDGYIRDNQHKICQAIIEQLETGTYTVLNQNNEITQLSVPVTLNISVLTEEMP